MSGKDQMYNQERPSRARSPSPRRHYDEYSSLGHPTAARPERSPKMKAIQTHDQREKMICRSKCVADILAQKEQEIKNIRAGDQPYRFENDRLKKDLTEKDQEIRQLKGKLKYGDDVIRKHIHTIERLNSEKYDLTVRRDKERKVVENRCHSLEDEISKLRKSTLHQERGPTGIYNGKYSHTSADILTEVREHNLIDYHKENTRLKNETTELREKIGELEVELHKIVTESDSFKKEAWRIFRKQTSDFEKDTTAYQECICKLKGKLKSIEEVVQTEDTDIGQGKPSVFSKAQQMKNENVSLQRELSNAKADSSRFSEDIKRLTSERDRLKARNTDLTDENKILQKALIDYQILKTQQHNVSEENRELRQQLKDIENKHRSDKKGKSSDEARVLQNENKRIRHVNETLSHQIQQIEQSKEKMKEQISCLEETNVDLVEKLRRIQSQQARDESLKIKRCQVQIDNLQSENLRQKEHLSLQMKEMRHNLDQDKYDLNQNNTALQVEKLKLEEEVSTLKDEIEQQDIKITNQRKEIVKLQKDFKGNNTSQHTSAEKTDAGREYNMTDYHKENTRSQTKIKQLKGRIEELEAELQQAVSESDDNKTEACLFFREQTNDYENKATEYEDYIHKLEAKLKRIEDVVQTENTQIRQGGQHEVENMKIENARLKRDLSYVEGDNTRLSKDISDTKSERDRLRARNTELCDENEQLHGTSVNYEILKTQHKNVCSKNEKLRQQLENMKSDETTLSDKHRHLNKTIKDSDTVNNDLRCRNEALSLDIKQAETNYKQMKKRVLCLTKDNHSLSTKNQQLDMNVADLKNEIEKLTENNKTIDDKLKTLKIKNSELVKMESVVSEEFSTLSEENRLIKRELQECKEHMDKVEKQNTSISNRNADLEKAIKHMKSNNVALDEKTRQNVKVDELNYDLQQQNDDLNKRNISIQIEKEKIQRDIAALKDEIGPLRRGDYNMQKDIKKLEEDLERNKTSHSVRHSASQMGRDGTKVDYRSRKARPSFIHDEYAQLSIQTGSNIKQNMQKPYGVDDKTWRDFKNDFVCGLFMESRQYMENLRQQSLAQLTSWIKQPLASTLTNATVDNSTFASETQTTIMNLFREHSREIDVKAHCQKVMSRVLNKAIDNGTGRLSQMDAGHCVRTTDIDNFVESVCKLSWQMLCQQPPMTFTTVGVGQPADEDVQDIIPTRDLDFSQMDRLVVERYMEPTLQHGIHIMEKGRVLMCRRKRYEFIRFS